MTTVLEKPTAEGVRSAAKRFDEENRIIENALGDLFRQYPENTDPARVLLKVAALNALYSTQIPLYSNRIPTISDVAHHIIQRDIDSDLQRGLPDLVDAIAATQSEDNKKCYNYSFATKYCNWHRPDFYPIWDSRVDRYLWQFRNQETGGLGGFRKFKRKELWSYPTFKQVVVDFRVHFNLGEFSFKEIDKFLYIEGSKLFAQSSEQGLNPDIPAESRAGRPGPRF
jgi:hypothetical protein